MTQVYPISQGEWCVIESRTVTSLTLVNCLFAQLAKKIIIDLIDLHDKLQS